MNPTSLIPAADPIPAPALLFEILGGLTLLLHLLAVNMVVGGLILGIARSHLPTGSRRSPFWPGLPIALALAINLGVAPLLFLQVNWGGPFYAASVLMARSWLAIIPVLIVAYYGLYLVRAGRWTTWLAPAVLLLLLGIGFVLVNDMTLMLEPGRWLGWEKARGGTLHNLAQPLIWPRWLHFVVASVAVGGLTQAGLEGWARLRKRPVHRERRAQGLTVFAWATKAQLVVGLIQLAVLPSGLRALFLGRSPLLSGALGLGVLAALGAIIAAQWGKLWPTIGFFLPTMALMVTTRQLLRLAFQRGVDPLTELPLDAEYGPLVMFAVALLLGVAVVTWLVRLALRATAEEAP